MDKTVAVKHFADWRDKIDAHSETDDAFLNYFDSAANEGEAFCQGHWDFAHHILKPSVIPLIGDPFQASALEIGFGGGRLLNASSQYFNHVYGVDIHDHFDKVRKLLHTKQVTNVTLYKGDGKHVPAADHSIDFVYSFIVLQHLPTLDILVSYLREIKRILKPGKPAVLYVGHLPFNWHRVKYVDLKTRHVSSSRENTLLLRPQFTKTLMRQAGLNVIEVGYPRKKPWRLKRGEQHFVAVTA